MPCDVRTEQSTGRPLAVVHRRGSRSELSAIITDACGTVWNVLKSQQVAGVGRHVAIYWDDQINFDVGVEMETPFAGHGEVVGAALPIGPVATATHFGPYGQLGAAHQAICDWCAANGHLIAGPSWEIYGHWENSWNSDPAKIRTDVYYLLVEANASG